MPGGDSESFEPPGPGTWFLDPTHFIHPVTRFAAEVIPEPLMQGFREGTRRYGLLLDYLDWAFVHGFGYWSPRLVGVPPGESEPPSRAVWEALAQTHPEVGERLRASETVFERRIWRDDLHRWDQRVKPAALRAHRELLAIDPRALHLDALLAHLDRCREHLWHNWYLHHSFTVTALVPVGDFLAHGQEWTGRPAPDLLALLRGATPISRGAVEELERLAGAIREDRRAITVLGAAKPADEVLHGLRSWAGEVGQATADYLAVVAHLPVNGHDVGEPCAVEFPDLLLGTIRQAVEGPVVPAADDDQAGRVAEVRAAIPEPHRGAFDDLLAEARLIYRIRDERDLCTIQRAEGIARRAILAAGWMLAKDGRLDDPALFVEADYAEMHAMLERHDGPTGEELAARARYRTEATFAEAPPLLGPPPAPPFPLEWLPLQAARLERAMAMAIEAVLLTPAARSESRTVRGLPAGEGVAEGPARVVRGTEDFARLRPGDVLVAVSTTPAFTVVLPLLAAIVTDTGGLLSHAAIVARENGIPAVVGCTDATRRIPDGARLRVDTRTGEVTVLSARGLSVA